jgi:hypothetical protein
MVTATVTATVGKRHDISPCFYIQYHNCFLSIGAASKRRNCTMGDFHRKGLAAWAAWPLGLGIISASLPLTIPDGSAK